MPERRRPHLRAQVLRWPLLGLVGLSGCLALGVFHPRPLTRTAWLRPAAVQAPVEIVVDDLGVSHVFARSTADAVHGLGYLHGRERLFQVDLMRRAARGRLAELFGEDLLPLDRRLRLLGYHLDAAVAALGDDERVLIDAYLAGLQRAIDDAPALSFEHRLLGVGFDPLTAHDVLAIARLQSWDLSLDHEVELLRAELRRALGEGADWLLPDVPALGAPILDEVPASRPGVPAAGPTLAPAEVEALRPPPDALAWVQRLGLPLGAASNSLVVGPARARDGHPLLENDTHLQHAAPGVFYLTHLVAPDLDVIGYTFPGIPAVLIGSTPHLSWGFTTSYVDVQDLYRLTPAPGDAGAYLLDGQAVPFERSEQVFGIGHGVGARSEREVYLGTVFGPVLNPGREARVDPAAPHALAWAGFSSEPTHAHVIRAFFELYRAREPQAARRALRQAGLVFQNAVLATAQGDIAYVLVGAVPRRAPGHDGSVLQDGSTRRHLWQGFVDDDALPFVVNPPAGAIVAANQRVTAAPRGNPLGAYASHAYRALRLREWLDHPGGVDGAHLRRLWRDATSVQPRRTLPAILAHWPVPGAELDAAGRARWQRLRQVLARWDHGHGIDSVGATVYDALYRELTRACFEGLLSGPTLERYLTSKLAVVVLDDALEAVGQGRAHPLLDGGAALQARLAVALGRAEPALREALGRDVEAWTWGRLHTLTLRHPMGLAWPLDAALNIGPYPVAGCWSCPACEVGTPVYHGAAMRTLVELGPRRRVHMILDSGNAGYAGHPNYDNMARRFVRGASLEMLLTRDEIEARAAGRVALLPRREPSSRAVDEARARGGQR